MENFTINQMEKHTITVKVTKTMLRSGSFTIQKTVVHLRKNRNNMKIGRRNPLITPMTENRMIEIPSGIM